MRRSKAGLAGVLAGAMTFVALGGVASAAAPVEVRGSVEQVYATGLKPGARMTLMSPKGKAVVTKQANAQGGLLFRRIKPGSGYSVKPAKGGAASPKVTVLSSQSAPPDTSVYDQEISSDGYGYLTTRDGTKLAINVHPPTDVKSLFPEIPIPELPTNAPRPVLIEYAGYGYADPAGPESGISLLANLMGFTVVNVNMRGTGCSGGAFDFFETLQSLDGYDVIETIARQPWTANGKVGMMGISYGGISQLFTAQTNPPSLAAIAPLSVLDSTQTTLYPGGILNTGFALEWAKDRVHDALPASPDGGQAWAWKRIQEGDQTCAANQTMHGEAVDLLAKVRRNDHYKPKVADPLAPITFVNKINVPTFMACQFTDEQTGGHCPTLASRMTGTDRKWFTFTNGVHTDSLDPETFNRWYDFMKLYVAREAPALGSALIRVAAPLVYEEALGIGGLSLPADPIQQQPSYEAALAAFEQLPSVRFLFDNGAGGAPGHPYPGYEQSFDEFPVPGTKGQSWYLGGDGSLGESAAAGAGADRFIWDADARPPTNFSGNTGSGDGGLWTATPPYEWAQSVKGKAVSYLSPPLKADTTAIGAGYVRAWLRASAPSVDLQATVTEVRPDGKETFVQSGWLRAKERKLDRRQSTPLAPVLSLRASDTAPLPKDRFTKLTIPLYYQAHAYRADSRIRVTISAVGGDQPIWAFAKARPKGTADVDVAYGGKRRSRLTLPIVPGVTVPTGLPPCPGLRGEPCRDFVPFANTPAPGS